MISVVILTLNEEANLADCLASVAWCDDVVVFDSYSTDRTVEIARQAGARVHQRQFDDYGSQRNAALSTVAYGHEWVLMVDADERWREEIFREMEAVVGQDRDKEISLCYFRRRDFFCGRWLRRSSGYPTWAGRLVRPGHVRIGRRVNEECHTAGGKVFMQSHFLHYPFSKGMANWIERHNVYSSLEARAFVEERGIWPRLGMLISRDTNMRRKAIKQLAYRLPCRPLLVFCFLYFWRLGFLDGMAGLRYCRLRAMYERMIDLKVSELRREGNMNR